MRPFLFSGAQLGKLRYKIAGALSVVLISFGFHVSAGVAFGAYMTLADKAKKAGVVGDAGVLVNAVILSRPHPDVYKEVI
jgi:hypothetical protein